MLSQFNKGPLQTSITMHGCYGGVVKARYDTCEEPVAWVSYSQVGTDFVIASFAVHPLASVKEAQLAGDQIDALLEVEALKLGIKRLLLVHPHQDTAEEVRTYQVPPFVLGVGVTSTRHTYIN